MTDMILSHCSGRNSCEVGSQISLRETAKYLKNSQNFSQANENMKILGRNKQNLIGSATIGTYDITLSTAAKVAEMDQKLNKICQKLNIEA